MRPDNLSTWQPKPNHVYYIHGATSPTGDAVGFSIMREGAGRQACHGADTNHNDGYIGDVYVDRTGATIEGGVVQYYRGGIPDKFRNHRQPDLEVRTNASGKHTAHLEPGEYEYRCLMPAGSGGNIPVGYLPDKWQHKVTVLAGRSVRWEHAPEVVEGQARDLQGAVAEREIGYIAEELLLDWHNESGERWSWVDVEETLIQVNTRIEVAGAQMRRLSVSPFVMHDFCDSLTMRGVLAENMGWRSDGPQFAIAFKNMAALLSAHLAGFSPNERAKHQTRQVIIKDSERGTESVAGELVYLAQARAGAIYFAAQGAAYERPGVDGAQVLTPPDGAMDGARAMEAMKQVFGLRGLS